MQVYLLTFPAADYSDPIPRVRRAMVLAAGAYEANSLVKRELGLSYDYRHVEWVATSPAQTERILCVQYG